MRKIFLISIIGLIIALISISFFRIKKSQVKFNQGTGAITEKVSFKPDDPFVQLYKLLDAGVVVQDNFTITPVKKDRYIIVELTAEDKANAKNEFNAWLKANNFDNIPSQKIKFR